MSDWQALLWLLAGLAVVGLVNLLIVMGGLAAERADKQAAETTRSRACGGAQ